MFQTNGCSKFHINGTLFGSCEGTYDATGQYCRGYPMYEKTGPAGAARRTMFRVDTGEWQCGDAFPPLGSSCTIGAFVVTSAREHAIGKWSDSAWANCLD